MLDLFAGRLGWAKAFAARGWECVAVDLTEPPEIPQGVTFLKCNVLALDPDFTNQFDFACASSPCEEFSCFTMKHFRPNPPYPEMGMKLFTHTREILAALPHVIENVRGAEQFVGPAVSHCGPFYLWGNAVPPILPQGIKKASWFKRPGKPGNFAKELLLSKPERKAKFALIPAELANCVAEYAERIVETTWGPFALNQGMESD